MDTSFDVVIVGSGASAVGVLEGLKSLWGSSRIAVLTTSMGPATEGTGSRDRKFSLRGFRSHGKEKPPSIKTYFGERHYFDRHELWDTESVHFRHSPNFTFGGLTQIWGAAAEFTPNSFTATIDKVKLAELEKITSDVLMPHSLGSKIEEDELSICEQFKDLAQGFADSKRWSWKPSKLAVNTNFDVNGFGSCSQCGNCLHGCPENAIWNAKTYMDGRVRRDEINVVMGYAKRFQRLPNEKMRIEYSSGDNLEQIIETRCLVLANGPLQSTKMISDYVGGRDFYGSDTSLCQRIAICKPARSRPTHNLSHVTGLSSADDYVQLYPPNEQVWEGVLPSKITRSRGFKFLSRCVVPILLYRSPREAVIFNHNQNAFIGKRLLWRRPIRGLYAALFRERIFLLPLVSRRLKAGASFHTAGFLKEYLDPSGVAKVDDCVFVAGSSTFTQNRAGPITADIISQGISTGDHIAKRILRGETR